MEVIDLSYCVGWFLFSMFEIFMGIFTSYNIQPVIVTDNTLPDILPVIIAFCSIFTAIFVLVNNQKDLLNTRRYFVVAQLTKIWASLYFGLALCILARFQNGLPIQANNSLFPIVGGLLVYSYCCMPLLVFDCLYTMLPRKYNAKLVTDGTDAQKFQLESNN
jgi:hypothetical protein